jgi:hypothetical protein
MHTRRRGCGILPKAVIRSWRGIFTPIIMKGASTRSYRMALMWPNCQYLAEHFHLALRLRAREMFKDQRDIQRKPE